MRVICGAFWGKRGPVDGIAADPRYLDISVPPGRRRTIPVPLTTNAFAYVFAGSGTFRDASEPRLVATELVGQGETPVYSDVGNRSLVVFDRGDEITVQAGDEGFGSCWSPGSPIEEPVAWYGPIVMNTEAELRQAFAEIRQGTFIKHS